MTTIRVLKGSGINAYSLTYNFKLRGADMWAKIRAKRVSPHV
jgi:hypothetical protein